MNYGYMPMYQPPTLNGRIVEGEEIVKTLEVPFNSYGLFPKADMTVIYVKNWNNDGTTKITKYFPVNEKQEDPLSGIRKSIADLSKKIDGLKPTSPMKKRKEVDEDDE